MPVSNLWKSSGACYETAMKSFRFSDAREWAAAALMAAALFSAARGAEKILPDTQALAEVAAGKCREVRAAWWGFDPADSTAALQAVGVTSGTYLLNAAPYILTLVILVLSSSSRRRIAGAPGELSVTK